MKQKSYADLTSVMAPGSGAFDVTPDDSADLPTYARALYIGTSGDLVVRAVESDADVTFRNVVGGSVIALRCRAIRATGTTASDIVAIT